MLMGTIAEREGLSRKYLHTLLTALKSAGLVRSVRGAGGGFVLARDPSEITLAEILYALEGPLSLVPCVGDEGACDRTGQCTARQVWQELSGVLEAAVDDVTLGDMLGPQYRAGESPSANKSNAMRKPGPRRKAGWSRNSGPTSRSRPGSTGKS